MSGSSHVKEQGASRFREQRRRRLSQDPAYRGLDGAEARWDGESQRWWLVLHMVPAPPGQRAIPPGLTAESFRLRPVAEGTGHRLAVTEVLDPYNPLATTLKVAVEPRGNLDPRALQRDPNPYRVELVDVPRIDPLFSSATFSFLPSGLRARAEAAGELLQEAGETLAPLDYMARDYRSLRALMLDRMELAAPDWRERNPADLGVAVVEALAYAGDQLSYYQDAVATEAYLSTARRRISVSRHARLVDYQLSEGLNARVWIRVEVEEGAEDVPLPRGSQFLTRGGDLPAALSFPSPEYDQALASGARVFESCRPQRLFAAHRRLPFHTWGAQDYRLPAGATGAALAGHLPDLREGDVLILEETGDPATGEAGGALVHRRWPVRLSRRPVLTHDPLAGREEGTRESESGAGADPGAPVTEIRWHREDALPFPLTVARSRGGRPRRDLAVARGNVVLADHGMTVIESLPPVPRGRPFQPVLSLPAVTFRQPPPDRPVISARRTLEQDPEATRPMVELLEEDELVYDPHRPPDQPRGPVWRAVRDLLGSGPMDRHFVVEVETDGSARLRFGDGRHGRRPTPQSRLWAFYRVGAGPAGNVGPGAVRHAVTDDPRVTGATNPLMARGGLDREGLDHARFHAPPEPVVQERCVTEDDFVQILQRDPEVLGAAVRLCRTGTWRTAFVHVQRRGGAALDRAFRVRLRALLAPRLLAADQVRLLEPRWAALELKLRVRPRGGGFAEVVRRRLLEVLGDGELPRGGRGFFHPDRFTFGQPVYASQVLDEARGVRGVEEVEVETFRRRDGLHPEAARNGTLETGPREIVLLRNDPASPQLGRLEIVLEGAP